MGFENESVGGFAPESEVGFETDDIDLDNGAMPAARAVKAKRSPRDHMEPRQGGIKRDRLGRRSYDENGDEDLGEGAELIAPSRPVRVSGSGMSGMRTNRLMSENSEFGYLFSDTEPEDRHMSASRSSRLDALAYDEKQDGDGSQYESLFSDTESMVRRKENRRPAGDAPIGVREPAPKPAEPTPSEPIAMPKAPRRQEKAEKKPEPAPAPAPAAKSEEKHSRFSLRGRKDKDAKNAPGRQPELPPEPPFGDRDFERDRRYDDRRFDDRRFDDRRYDDRRYDDRRFDDRRYDDRRYDDRRYDDRRGAYPPPGYPYPPAYPQYPYPPQYPAYPSYPAYQPYQSYPQYPQQVQQVLYPQGVDANGQVIYSTVPGAMPGMVPGAPVIVYQTGVVPGTDGAQMPAIAPVAPVAPAAAPAAEPELIEEEIVPPAAPPLVAAPPAQPVQPAPAAPKEEPIGEDIFGDGPLPTPPSPPPARRSQPSEGGSRFNRRSSAAPAGETSESAGKPAEKTDEAPVVNDPTPPPAAGGSSRFNRRGASSAPKEEKAAAPAPAPVRPSFETDDDAPAPAPAAPSGGSRFNRRK